MKYNSARHTTARLALSPDEHLAIEEHIRRRAHELWLAGGRRQGTDQVNWLQAEQEILALYVVSHTDSYSSFSSGQAQPRSFDVEVS